MTRLAGIFGYPLAHSLSPAFQQAAFNHYGLDARYLAWETPPDALAAEVAKLRGGDFIGANVTIPHKQAVMALLDEVDPLAEAIGAVNTIVKRGGRLVGYNTDAHGFMRALKEDAAFEPSGRRALLLGAGGAARAAAFALCQEGVASLAIANRTLERAAVLATDLSADGASISAIAADDAALHDAALNADLIVNSTSVGMRHGDAEGQTPLAGGLIPHDAVALDMVYNPQHTPLLAAARSAGARAVGGMPMLIYQGAAAFEMWTGRVAPVEAMFAAGNVALMQGGRGQAMTLEERVTAFVDWPNVERSLRGYFRGLNQHQDVGRLAISAIETIAERVGSLEAAYVYADWRTAYSEIVPLLEANYRFRTVLVPRKASGGDRCDTTIVADIVDFTHTHAGADKPAILLCAGDADYAVAARRALERGFEVYVVSVSDSLAPELASLSTAVYLLERYFSDAALRSRIQLIPNIRAEDLPSLAEVRRWAGFVRLLYRMTQSLDYVTLLYFARRLSELRPRYGETIGEAHTSVKEAIALGIVGYGVSVPNPNNLDQYVQTIVLSNGHVLVRCILENIRVPSESSPDTPS